MTPKPSRLKQNQASILSDIKDGVPRAEIARRLGVPASTLKSFLSTLDVPEGDRQARTVSREDILEARVAELSSALKRDKKTGVAEERLLLAIEAALERDWYKLPDVEFERDLDRDLDPTAHHRQVVVLSDFHGGEVVDEDAVNGLNRYDWSIMESRVQEVVAGMLSHKRHSPALTGLDILFVGDMCSGSNHDELAQTNEFPLAEQGVKMGYLLGQLVEQLVPHYPSIRVVGVVGNHPRLVVKSAAKRVHDNMDYIAYIIAKQYLAAYDTVTFEVPLAGAHFHEVAGRTMYVWHGDGIRSSMPGVPWGGVMRRAAQIQQQHAKREIDHFVLGHFHQACVVQAGRIIMNGALKGTDEWVEKTLGGGGTPCQLLLTFDEKRERMTDVKYLTPTAGVPA